MGIPGELVVPLLERFEHELQRRLDPDDKSVVLVACGVNDSCPNNWLTKKQTPVEDFKSALQGMINVAQASSSKVAFIGLAPVNPARSKGLLFTNDEVQTYNRYIFEVCNERGVPFLDLFDDLMKANFPELLVDSVHPNAEGHQMLMEKVKEFLISNNFIEYCLGNKGG